MPISSPDGMILGFALQESKGGGGDKQPRVIGTSAGALTITAVAVSRKKRLGRTFISNGPTGAASREGGRHRVVLLLV
jgi:hypothetical protein